MSTQRTRITRWPFHVRDRHAGKITIYGWSIRRALVSRLPELGETSAAIEWGLSMATSSEPEDYNSLHERVLSFMGAFSSTQFAIDSVISMHLCRRMPTLGAALEKQFLGRVRDDQRLPLFEAFVIEVGYGGNLAHFRPIYNRAKQLRDIIGHSLSVTGPVYSWSKAPCVGVTRATSGPNGLVPDPLLPSSFTRLTADCGWMVSHIWRAGYTAEPSSFLDATGAPAIPPMPAEFPEGGEPLT